MNQYLQQIKEFLDKEEVRTSFEEESNRFETLYGGNHVNVHSRVCYVEDSQKLEHLVFLDAKVPPERKAEMCLLLNALNDYLNVCHFMLTRQDYVICVARLLTDNGATFSDGQIERFWRTPLNMVFDFEKTLLQVAFGEIDHDVALERFWDEHEKARKKSVETGKLSIVASIKKWVKGIGKN